MTKIIAIRILTPAMVNRFKQEFDMNEPQIIGSECGIGRAIYSISSSSVEFIFVVSPTYLKCTLPEAPNP